jgi:glycosyltransferase involved in cell wall biosynthesis
MGLISLRHHQHVENARFSILIPTWNNLKYLRLCIGSILKNSALKHQIIVHINEGTDGSLEWIKESGFSYTYSERNIGICWAVNALRGLADAEYLVFMNDDMYVCPGWDAALMGEIHSLPDNWFYLSSTLIQPRKFWDRSVISPAPFGEDTETFDEEGLLKRFMEIPHGDWHGSTWPPTVVHRDLWDLVGGFSVEFSPGLYSDPDFSAKLYMAGVRHFKGIDKSRVYHFEARSTGRVKKNKGTKQFLFKWGLTSSSFMRYILHRGEPFNTPLTQPVVPKLVLIRCRIKLAWGSFFAGGQSKKLLKP